MTGLKEVTSIAELNSLLKEGTLIEAEVVDDATEKYGVTTVPYFVIFRGHDVAATIEGADPPALTSKLLALSVATAAPSTSGVLGAAAPSQGTIDTRIKELLASAPVLLFMKGTPDAPRCGFSAKVVDALNQLNVKFSHFDILQNEEVRQALKDYSNWPTYPQIYVKGELLGGCDIVQEMHQNGELKAHLQQALGPGSVAPSLQERLHTLLHSAPVVLFMKGAPDQPGCGYSRKVCDALHRVGVAFKHFDILGDEEVRQGLKELSSWPTYPQLYVAGKLLGGCDIVQELEGEGKLKQEVDELLQGEGGSSKELRLKKLISSQPVMLFMKGTPDAPKCGFSRRVVGALQQASVSFGHFDILGDEEVRQGLKELSSWPTYPQLYVGGELLGGCDIVQDYASLGELRSTIDEMLHRMADA